MSRLYELLKEEVQNKKAMGAQAAVYQKGKLLVKESCGMEPDTIVRLYSMTKPVMAVAALMLFEEGKMDLLAPVSQFLPEFAQMTMVSSAGVVKCKKEMTIQHLLNMTSGLVYPDADAAGSFMQKNFDDIQIKADTEKAYTAREIVRKIASTPLAFEPGTHFRYGLGADVLGVVLEEITGEKLGNFLKRILFEPLGMKDTDFWVPKEKQPRLSELYQRSEEGLLPQLERHLGLGKGLIPQAYESGGAGLYSTMEDYAKFANMLAMGGIWGNERYLSRESIGVLTTNQLSEIQLEEVWEMFPHMRGYGYGNFCRVHMEPQASGSISSRGEFGWDGWSGPYVAIDPIKQRVFLHVVQVCAWSDWEWMRRMKAYVNAFSSNFEQND